MTGSLFQEPDGIEPGQIWVDRKLEEKGEPHPMRRVKVVGFDQVGMIILSSVFDSEINRYHMSLESLKRDYQQEE